MLFSTSLKKPTFSDRLLTLFLCRDGDHWMPDAKDGIKVLHLPGHLFSASHNDVWA